MMVDVRKFSEKYVCLEIIMKKVQPHFPISPKNRTKGHHGFPVLTSSPLYLEKSFPYVPIHQNSAFRSASLLAEPGLLSHDCLPLTSYLLGDRRQPLFCKDYEAWIIDRMISGNSVNYDNDRWI